MRHYIVLTTVVLVAATAGSCGDDDNRDAAYNRDGENRSVETGESGATAPSSEPGGTGAVVEPADVRLCFEARLNQEDVTEVEPYHEFEEKVVGLADGNGFGTMRLAFAGNEEEYGDFTGDTRTSDADPDFDPGATDRDDPENYQARPINLYFMADASAAIEAAIDFADAEEEREGYESDFETRGNVIVRYGHPTKAQRELIDNCLGEAGPPAEVHSYLAGIEEELRALSNEELLAEQKSARKKVGSADSTEAEVARAVKPYIDAEVERRGLE